MYRRTLWILLAFWVLPGLAAAAPGQSEKRMTDVEAQKFFNAQGCKSCHAAAEFRVGPSYQMIALRYQDASPDTIERLCLKVLHGGAGAWGDTPMISNPAVSMSDAQRIVQWILEANRVKKGD